MNNLIFNKYYKSNPIIMEDTKDKLINIMKTIINKSIKTREIILNMDLNCLSNRKKFISLLIDDITITNSFFNICQFIQHVNPHLNIKQNCTKILNIMAKHDELLRNSENMFNKITQFYIMDNDLNEDYMKFIKRIRLHYKKKGMNIYNLSKKNKYQIIINKINILEAKILSNIQETDISISLEYNDLKYIPDYKYNKNQLLTPDFFKKCMKYIKNSNTRKYIYMKYYTMCPNNIQLLMSLFILRSKQAKMLSYQNYCDMKVCSNMAKKSDNIKKFIKEISDIIDETYNKEMNMLFKLKKKDYENRKIIFDNQLNAWDIEYYYNQWKNEYGINELLIREYFPYDHVVRTIMDLYEKILNINIIKQDVNLWHDDVLLYKVTEKNKIIGYFYLDPFKRHNKLDITKYYSIQDACLYPFNENIKQIPVSILVTNIDKNSDIVLLNHQDIITLTHEMCHVLHNLCGFSKLSIFSGTNVQKDFIETPALAVEKLCWNSKIIKVLSSHYISKTKLPDDIISKLVKSRRVNIGYKYKTQIFRSTFDLIMHADNNFINICENTMKNNNPNENKIIMLGIYEKLYKKCFSYNVNGKEKFINHENDIFPPSTWKDIITGYDAQFYHYLWSDVYATDIYCDKIEKQWLNSNLKNKLLVPGGSEDAILLIRQMLGRDPNTINFFKYNKFNEPKYNFFNKTKLNNKSNMNIDSIKYSDSIEIMSEYNNNNNIQYNNNIQHNTTYNDNGIINEFTEINDSDLSEMIQPYDTVDINDTELYHDFTERPVIQQNKKIYNNIFFKNNHL